MRAVDWPSVYASDLDSEQVMSLTLPLSPSSHGMPPRTAAFGAAALTQSKLKDDGSNWLAFKLRARGLLTSVWHVIEPTAARGSGEDKKKGGTAAAAAAEAAADAKADSEYACSILTQLLPDDMLLVVQQELEQQDAAAVWNKLVAHFERKTTASKARLRSQLHSIIMHAGEKFDIYRSRVLSLAMQLEGMGEKVSEAERVHVLMKGLPNYYAAARDALQMQDSLTVESVSDKLRDVIERKEMERDEEEERANFAWRRLRRPRRQRRKRRRIPPRWTRRRRKQVYGRAHGGRRLQEQQPTAGARKSVDGRNTVALRIVPHARSLGALLPEASRRR